MIDDKIAIEVKGSDTISSSQLKGLKALSEDFPKMQKIVVTLERQPRQVEGIQIMHIDDFLKKLWLGEISAS